MRAYIMAVASGLVLIALLGLQFLASSTTASMIEADVDIVPDVLNLKRVEAPGGVITAYVGNLTKNGVSYDVRDINRSTIGLYYEGDFVTQALSAKVEQKTLIVKFDAATVTNYIWVKIVYHMPTIPPQADQTVTLTVKGQLINDVGMFAGSDTIKIILP